MVQIGFLDLFRERLINAPSMYLGGVTNTIWTARDGIENTGTFNQTVLVRDMEAPRALRPTINVEIIFDGSSNSTLTTDAFVTGYSF
jgi:hypothetical protein